MPDLFTTGGMAYLQDTQSGRVVPVPEGEIAQAIAAGFVPADDEAVRHARTMEHYGSTGNAWLAGLAGVGRGATFGLSDLLLTKTGAVAPETLAALREANPDASGAGSMIGAVGTALIPVGGVAGLTARAGTAAAKGAARALGTSATAAIPRLAGAVSREGLMGAALGAGQSVSDIALTPGEMSAGEIAARVLSGAGHGAAIGAGVGGLGWLAGTAGRAIKDKYTLGMEKIGSLRTERAALDAEAAALRESGAAAEQIARVDAQAASVAQQLHDAQVGALGKVLSRTASYALGHVVGGGLVGGLVGVLAGPKAIQSMISVLRPGAEAIGRRAYSAAKPYVDAAMERAGSAASSAWETVAPYVQRVAESPAYQAVAVEAAGQVASKARGFASAMGEAYPVAAAALGGAVARIPDSVATGAMIGGAPGAAVGLGAHVLSKPVGQAIEGLMRKVSPPARIAMLESLTRDDLSSIASELGQVTPEQIDAAVRMSLPENAPPSIRDGVSQRLQGAVAALQAQQRPAGPQSASAGADGAQKPIQAASEQAIRAVVDPGSMLVAFARGTLTPPQVQAWRAVYPEALAQVQAIVRAEVARTHARGGKYDRDRAEQLSILLQDKSFAPRLSQPATFARIQALHQAARAQRRPAPRARALELSGQMRTEMQSIRRRGV